jgi:hypothetical protein
MKRGSDLAGFSAIPKKWIDLVALMYSREHIKSASSPTPQTDSDTRPACRDIQDCRVGDWQHASFVYNWRGKSGVQKYQPPDRLQKRWGRFDESEFLPDVPVWRFQRQIWPGMTTSSGTWDVWLRIE